MDQRLLELLCCPVNKQPLKPIGYEQLQALNRAIAAGGVLRVDGEVRSASIQDALIRDDGRVIYVIDDGIPVLLADEAIGTTQFDNFPQ